ncbi:MAG: 3',5'-cyclic-nucleotide phosphodiesterase [endosymbiont of Galathealinum brachiosum]|uniref:3',5'-cyclic-nucleotide phosphodiesterase n=1 Tax=endosymbiont of Galathealinum brachiosum TaxID=2200906 RepID=A0A370DAC8_9GAMM|nr:MAG: 3',5'-cyclic-nucleotide phosphodiesterase [endosymbiont of Galathealinum brachiosum]
MKLRVLGCSGGIGQGLHTSSYMIDDDILLDAGTGVGDLSLQEMHQLKHIFITHSHMDHVLSIPLLVDTLFSDLQDQPLLVYARAETIKTLKEHIFNWQLWPDFTELPSKENPSLKLIEMNPGDVVSVGERHIEMVDVNHTVPASAYIVESASRVFAYSGDTTTNDNLWDRLNQYSGLDFMIVETAFSEEEIELARLAKHYCPSLLAQDLKKLKHKTRIGVSHLKPGDEEHIFKQCCNEVNNEHELCHLASDDHFQI